MKTTHANEARTSSSSYVGRAETQRLLALEEEKKTLTERLRQINTESEALYASLRSRIAPEFIGYVNPYRRPVEKPRKTEDKLAISAGRAIVAGVKKRLPFNQIKEDAIQAATKVAKKYGMEILPAAILDGIDRNIRSKTSLYSTN